MVSLFADISAAKLLRNLCFISSLCLSSDWFILAANRRELELPRQIALSISCISVLAILSCSGGNSAKG